MTVFAVWAIEAECIKTGLIFCLLATTACMKINISYSVSIHGMTVTSFCLK